MHKGLLKTDEETKIRVADYSGGDLNRDSWGVRVYDWHSSILYFDSFDKYRNRRSPKTEWITLRVQVRMEGLRRTSDHLYQFRFGKELGFEVEECERPKD